LTTNIRKVEELIRLFLQINFCDKLFVTLKNPHCKAVERVDEFLFFGLRFYYCLALARFTLH